MKAAATFARLSGHQRIAGQLVRSSGGEAIDVWDPATEERIGQIADADAADVDQAVAAANSAQRSWRSVNFHRPAELPHPETKCGLARPPPLAGKPFRPMAAPPEDTFCQQGRSPPAPYYYPPNTPPRHDPTA